MCPACLLVYNLLPLFATCQVWKPESPSTNVDIRLQGEPAKIGGALQLHPRIEKRLSSIKDVVNTGLHREADNLFNDGTQGLLVDLRGAIGPAKVRSTDSKLGVSQLYRVQNEGPGCDDPDLKPLTFAASDDKPSWSVRVNNQDLRLDHPEHGIPALPYVVEELLNDSTNYSNEASGKKAELWVVPSSRIDSISGAFSSYFIELCTDGETLRGCTRPGALGK